MFWKKCKRNKPKANFQMLELNIYLEIISFYIHLFIVNYVNMRHENMWTNENATTVE